MVSMFSLICWPVAGAVRSESGIALSVSLNRAQVHQCVGCSFRCKKYDRFVLGSHFELGQEFLLAFR